MRSLIVPSAFGTTSVDAVLLPAVLEGELSEELMPPSPIPPTNNTTIRIIGPHTVGLDRTRRWNDLKPFLKIAPRFFAGGKCGDCPEG